MVAPGLIGITRPTSAADDRLKGCVQSVAAEPFSPGHPDPRGRPGRPSWPSARADVHWVALPVHEGDIADHLAVLSTPERLRAARFRFAADRIRCVVSRASLRRLLAHYLGLDPRDVALAEGPHGKPILADRSCTLTFNTAHSGDLVVHVVTACSLVGIDVERIRREPLGEAMLREFLSPTETRRLSQMPRAEAHLEAHRIWTHKEAYLKALGSGLSVDPRQVEVALGAEPRIAFGARISRCTFDALTPCWSVWDLACPAGYMATLVRSGRPVRLKESVVRCVPSGSDSDSDLTCWRGVQAAPV